MRLHGSAVTDWRHTGVHPRYGVRLESATLATHVYVQPHMIAATDASPAVGRQRSAAGERDLPPAPGRAPIAARATDPDTAHLAAASITDQARRDVHRQVLAILAEGPASDFDLAARTGLKQTSVGKRRGELRDMGLVTELDHNGVSDTGSACCRWRLTDAGWAAA